MSRYTDLKKEYEDEECDPRYDDGAYLIDIIEKQKEALKAIIGLEWWGIENPVTTIAKKALVLTEEADKPNESLRDELGTFDIDTTPEELQKLREE